MNIEINKESDFVLVDDAVKELNFSRTHMSKLIERGEVETVVIDAKRYISQEELNRFDRRRKIGNSELMNKFADHKTIERDAVSEIAELL